MLFQKNDIKVQLQRRDIFKKAPRNRPPRQPAYSTINWPQDRVAVVLCC